MVSSKGERDNIQGGESLGARRYKVNNIHSIIYMADILPILIVCFILVAINNETWDRCISWTPSKIPSPAF